MNDTSLIVDIMKEQGVLNIVSITDLEHLGGGSTAENMKAYINWIDFSKTKVQIKGNKQIDEGTSRYREALFNSRLMETLSNYGISYIPSFTSVADIHPDGMLNMDYKSTSLEVNQFMLGWTDMNSVYYAVSTGHEDDLDLPNFDWPTTQEAIMELLATFHGSHWLDTSLFSQFYLKGADWINYEG